MVLINKQPKLSCHMASMPINDRRLIMSVMLICYGSAKFFLVITLSLNFLCVLGDLMGTTVNNLNNLLRMPYGCGEQNMVNFAPDVFITDYLAVTNQLTGDIKKKALTFMEKGRFSSILCPTITNQKYLCTKQKIRSDLLSALNGFVGIEDIVVQGAKINQRGLILRVI